VRHTHTCGCDKQHIYCTVPLPGFGMGFSVEWCFFREVHRIKAEHVDDVLSIMNDHVKGTLKVTRAFGASFLKQVRDYPFKNLPNAQCYINLE
jgi:hypothetical protein